jgi:hypothetical protein
MTNAPRTVALSGLIAVALFSFSAGGFLMIGVDNFAKGNGQAWAFVGCSVFMMVTAVIVGRRTLLAVAPKL